MEKAEGLKDTNVLEDAEKTGFVDRHTGLKENIRADLNGSRWIGSHISMDETVLTPKGRGNILEQVVGGILRGLTSLLNLEDVAQKIDSGKLDEVLGSIKQSVSRDKDALFALARLDKEDLNGILNRSVKEHLPGLTRKNHKMLTEKLQGALMNCCPAMSKDGQTITLDGLSYHRGESIMDLTAKKDGYGLIGVYLSVTKYVPESGSDAKPIVAKQMYFPTKNMDI